MPTKSVILSEKEGVIIVLIYTKSIAGMETILCADEATRYLWRRKGSGNYEEQPSTEEFIELSSL